MTYEMELPARVAEIDTEIQTLELLQQGLDGLQAMRASLDEAKDVLGRMSEDLGGETLSASDIININPNPTTGEWEVEIDTTKIDPLTLDKTSVPANLAKEAIRAQQALEEIAKPFADHQSKLLESLEKLSSGLDRASELFASTKKAIETLENAWDLFDRAMAGEISADELIDAFDSYFSTVIEVLADTIGKVPGLGAFLEIYAKAIKSIVPDLKLISASRAQKNAVIASVFNDAPPPPPAEEEPTDVITGQQESLAAQIDALKEERLSLLSEHEAEQARRAVLEVDQLEKLAERRVQQSTGYPFEEAKDITFSMQNSLWIGWPSQIEALAASDPDDPRIGEIREKMAITIPKLRDALGTRYRMEAAKVEEIERMIREHPEVLSPADLLELQNRYPQLEDAISDIRAGNPLGTETFEQIEARAAAAAAALDAERESAEEDDADDFSPTDDDDAGVPVAAAAGGMSPGTRKVVIFGGGGLLAGALHDWRHLDPAAWYRDRYRGIDELHGGTRGAGTRDRGRAGHLVDGCGDHILVGAIRPTGGGSHGRQRRPAFWRGGEPGDHRSGIRRHRGIARVLRGRQRRREGHGRVRGHEVVPSHLHVRHRRRRLRDPRHVEPWQGDGG